MKILSLLRGWDWDVFDIVMRYVIVAMITGFIALFVTGAITSLFVEEHLSRSHTVIIALVAPMVSAFTMPITCWWFLSEK